MANLVEEDSQITTIPDVMRLLDSLQITQTTQEVDGISVNENASPAKIDVESFWSDPSLEG